jgi:ketol-acid reductoisomerase
MSKMYHQQDVNPELLAGKKVAILGYGSQGRAQSLNLRDSDVDVVVGLCEGGKNWEQAEQQGVAEHEAGSANLKKMLAANENHVIEEVGESVRQHMGWLKP